ncbi:protein ALP1-like [Haliotis rubra]|uniref:protein ALP1-like n=1 Tax=Haliotis rubra TaxID=36100 RepID=UPI001EE5ADF0|nr:protein ALP1-like [Haliotis rubra]
MEDENAFANYVRMPPHMFDELLNRISPVIQRRDTHMRPALDAGMKLAMTLRHLATGDRYHTIQYDFRCGYSTVVWIVQEVCQAIIQELKDEVMPLPRTQEDWKDIAQQFQDRWNVPHALGALDGKHIAIRKPHNSGSVFFNYKGFSPVVLLALVDADYKFIWIDTGGEGHQSDAQLFGASELKECIDDNTINFPDSDPLPNDDRDTPYYILGDDAFPLRTFLMKPYGRRGLDNDMLVANYRLSRGRRVVENGFGILANRWRCFLGTLEQGPDVVRLLVETGVILHNLLRIRFPAIGNADVDREDEDHNNIPGAWRADQQVEEIPQFQAPNRDNREGKVMRDYLKAYFNSEAGSVPWQERQAGVNVN